MTRLGRGRIIVQDAGSDPSLLDCVGVNQTHADLFLSRYGHGTSVHASKRAAELAGIENEQTTCGIGNRDE